jgi:inosose dehydratase
MSAQGTGTQDQPVKPLRIGTAPVNWNNFDLEDWRPVVPFPKILDEMLAAGYTATEWDASFGSDVDALNRERDLRRMSFTGAYRWLDFLHDSAFEHDLEEIRPFLGTLQAIGATHLIVADSLRLHRVALAGSVPEDGSKSLDAAGYDRIASNLVRLSDVVAPYGLHLHYHNHVGSFIEHPVEVSELLCRLERTPIDLCFDTGHYAFGGGDALAFVEANVAAIGYVHLKDVDNQVLASARKHNWSFLDALRNYIFCPLGEGNANISAIVDRLIDEQFGNYVIIEQDTCRSDQSVNAQKNLDVVNGYISASQQRRLKS